MSEASSSPRPSDRWIPYYFFAFFIVLISILVPMGIIAVRTNTGVVTNQAYEKGLSYNKTIAAGEKQAALNWKGNVSLQALPNGKYSIQFKLTDATGKTIDNANASVWMFRPAVSSADQHVQLNAMGQGNYAADVSLPSHGLWEARIAATVKDNNYQLVKRLVLP